MPEAFCIRTTLELRAALEEARARGVSVGLVPTMGALHEGHLSLIRKARAQDGLVVVSIFVNPAQFDVRGDLEAYPRDLGRDLEVAKEAGADLVFSPPVAEMYPEDFATWVDVAGLTESLCGASRPGHFRGVCTVVAKLFNICLPDRAYFGEKDAQQLAVIRKMARELDFPVEIVPCATVREPDGLALSSRNARLSPEERAEAPVLYRALTAAVTVIENGERDTARIKSEMCALIGQADSAKIDYMEVVDAESLAPLAEVSGPCLIAAAVWFGSTRLIDNVTVRL